MIKIEFASWVGRAALEIETATLREAAEKEKANLSEANLSEANLREANLREANLSEANLSEANLSEANLSWADLSEANLSEANLREANLSGAEIGGKKLWMKRPVLTLGQCGRSNRTTLVFYFADGGDPLIYCGCFKGTIAQFEEKIHETHKGTFHEQEYIILAEHIKAIYALQKKELEK